MGDGSSCCKEHAAESGVHPDKGGWEKDGRDGKAGRDPRKKDEEKQRQVRPISGQRHPLFLVFEEPQIGWFRKRSVKWSIHCDVPPFEEFHQFDPSPAGERMIGHPGEIPYFAGRIPSAEYSGRRRGDLQWRRHIRWQH